MSSCRTITCREHVTSEQGCLERVLQLDTRHLPLARRQFVLGLQRCGNSQLARRGVEARPASAFKALNGASIKRFQAGFIQHIFG